MLNQNRFGYNRKGAETRTDYELEQLLKRISTKERCRIFSFVISTGGMTERIEKWSYQLKYLFVVGMLSYFRLERFSSLRDAKRAEVIGLDLKALLTTFW